MFPGGWPGAGLLVLRLAAAIPLLIEGCSGFWGAPHDGLYARFIAIGVGSLLLAGLWTPVAGGLDYLRSRWHTQHAPFARGARSKPGNARTRRMVCRRPAIWQETD